MSKPHLENALKYANEHAKITDSIVEANQILYHGVLFGWDAAMKEMEIFREVVEFMRDYCNPTEPGFFETYANLLMNAEAALDRL